uniref:GST N-terminal domain-containing protein n=1 Tax=Hanusia phi TaxID=3032 RepID=A0A7S0DZ82_9CRYP|mmetsp:Transcript_11725/g.26886  ORF Transcript_11725/g.26886 Transcript_11725/m.26886 type:complete len:126 (+) Transcript_11725:277-654(+)
MSDVTLYTNKMCPFAQKAWIALEEKKVKYELVEINLYGSGGKPGWFLDMNPKGQVPVLKHGDKVVVESDEILKYIDRNMGSAGDLTRGCEAEVATWMKFLGSEILPSGKALINGYGSQKSLHVLV